MVVLAGSQVPLALGPLGTAEPVSMSMCRSACICMCVHEGRGQLLAGGAACDTTLKGLLPRGLV